MQWNMDHSRHNIGDVAAGYDALPKFDPKAVHAWQALADESKKHADYIRKHLNITETDNPEPYDTSEDMIRDIRNNRNFVVSTANSDHPIWTPEQNVDFRIVHDVFGHAATEGDFGWHGENDACSTHFALSSPHAQKALATECLGQTGYAINRGGFTDQRVGFIPGLHEGLAAANKDTPVPTQQQLMQRALYGPQKQSKWKVSASPQIENTIQSLIDLARSKGIEVHQSNEDGLLMTDFYMFPTYRDPDGQYLLYIHHGAQPRIQARLYNRSLGRDVVVSLNSIKKAIENYSEEDEVGSFHVTNPELFKRVSKWKIADKHNKRPKNQSKHHINSISEYKKSLKQYGPLKSHNVKKWKKKGAMDPQDHEDIFDNNDPYMYHGINIDASEIMGPKEEKEIIHSIMNNGILPRTQTQSPFSFQGFWQSRPNHAYVGHREKGIFEDPPLFKIDMRKIDPAKINPDEDFVWNQYHGTSPYQIDKEQLAILPKPPKSEKDSDKSLGEWMHTYGPSHWDSPHHTRESYFTEQSLAIDGGIPADAISINEEIFEENEIFLRKIANGIESDYEYILENNPEGSEERAQFFYWHELRIEKMKQMIETFKVYYNRFDDDSKKSFDSFVDSVKYYQYKLKQLRLMARNKVSQDANRMYRQHTDGPPAAETTFESIQNEDTSEEHEDEEVIVNGKKWKKVRRKNNPQPDTYKDPIGGWGFYSNFDIDNLIERFTPKWNIITSNVTPPLEQEKLWDYAQTIPKNYILVKDEPMIERFMRFGLLPITGKYTSHAENNLSLTNPPKNQGFNRPIDFSVKHDVYFWDPRERHIVYGITYTLNNSEAHEEAISEYNDNYGTNVSSDPTDMNYDLDILSEDQIKTKSVPTYVDSIHYVDPNPPKEISGPFVLQPAKIDRNGNYLKGNEFVLWNSDELGKPRSQDERENAYIDKFNQKYPRFTMNLLRWMKDALPGPFGADIVNPKLRDVVQRHPKLVQFSKWKISVPPAEKAEEFGEGYKKAPAPSAEQIEEKYKYNKDPRGHRWQLNKENLERLYNHPDWPLESRYNVFPLSLEQAQLKGREKPDLTHWNRAALGTHESPQSKGRSGFIYINPLISPESANEALWHELQHAYQHQEERFTKELRDAYFDPTKIDPSLTDEEVAKKFEEEYVKHPMEIDANLFADFMRRYPIIEEADPVYKDSWVGRVAKDVDIKDAIDKYYEEYGSKRRLPLPSIKSKWKIAGMTKKKLLELGQTLPEDTSEIVHQFDDGWTIRKGTKVPDAYREGQLMGNCIGDIESSDDPSGYRCMTPEEVEEKKELDFYPFYSLRDTDNIPHVSIRDGLAEGRHGSEIKNKYKKYLDQFFTYGGKEDNYHVYNDAFIPLKTSVIKEAPARSKAQYRYMQGICNGSIEPPKGMTRAQACEYVEGQSPKNLPEKKSFWDKLEQQQEMEKTLLKMGFSEKAAVVIALDNISKLSYWMDGYHAAVALRDPETGIWHMDVGFNDKLTHGGVTADYINDLGTKAMRKAVADKESRTDYYNHHTARGLYNPETKDFVHMSHPDLWDEKEYNFKDLDQDDRNKMEEFWRQLAQQNSVDIDSIRVLNNQTGHLEDLDISDLKVPYEVEFARRMYERNRPLNPWEREQGGYDTKTGSIKKQGTPQRTGNRKEAHWIKNYVAAIINQNGEMEIAKPEEHYYDEGYIDEYYKEYLEEGKTLEEWGNTHWDIGGMPIYRGLYNPHTKEVIHMTSPDEYNKISEGEGQWFDWSEKRRPEYLFEQEAINPENHKNTWLEAARKSNIPVSNVNLLYSKENEPRKEWGEENPESEFLIKKSKWKKTKKDAWEAVLDGELGHDILTTGSWEEVKKQTLKWLKQLKNGYINKENPHDNEKIDPKAKEQDGYAIESLKLYEEKKRWSFHFDHGKHPYDLIIQPVGYKQSKWKKISHWIEGFHAATIDKDGNMHIGEEWSTSHQESLPEYDSEGRHWRGLYNPTTGELIHQTDPDLYKILRMQQIEIAPSWKYHSNPNPDEIQNKWLDAAKRKNIPINDFNIMFLSNLPWEQDALTGEYESRQKYPYFGYPNKKEDFEFFKPEDVSESSYYKKSKWKKKSHWIEGFHAAVIDPSGNMHIAKDWNDIHNQALQQAGWPGGMLPNSYRGLYNPETQELFHMTSPNERGFSIGEYASEPSQFSDLTEHEGVWRDAADRAGIPVSNFAGLYRPHQYDEDGWRIDPHWYEENPKETFKYLPSKESKWKKVAVGLWDLNRTEPSHYFDTKVVEEIPVSVALQMLDLERGKEDYERENIQNLTQHITQHGILEPIIIDFNIDTNTAFVTEGNHRVQVAKQLGMEWIPARGVRNEGSKSRFKELSVRWQGTQTNHAGNLYIPPHFPPHMIGLPVKEKVKGFEDGWNYNGWETKESKWKKKSSIPRFLYHDINYSGRANPEEIQKRINNLKINGLAPSGIETQGALSGHPEVVYLTSRKDDVHPPIVQIDTSNLDHNLFVPDDDLFFDEWEENRSYESIGDWVHNNPELSNPENAFRSLKEMDTIGYRGTIPPNAITIINNKQSKWKKRSHWIYGFHAAGITPEGDMVVGPKWTTYHGEMQTPQSESKTFRPETGWRGLYNPETGELIHMSTPEEYIQFGDYESASQIKDFDLPHEHYKKTWESAANKSNYYVNSIHLLADQNAANPNSQNDKEDFILHKIGKV